LPGDRGNKTKKKKIRRTVVRANTKGTRIRRASRGIGKRESYNFKEIKNVRGKGEKEKK